MPSEPVKIIGMQVKQVDGVAAIVFVGHEPGGEVVELCVPTAAWDEVHQEGQRMISTAFNLANPPAPGHWTPSQHQDGAPFELATSETGRILLVGRMGLPGEVRLSLDRATALALSESLKDRALATPADNAQH